MTYRVLDLFSGIGGFALGLEAAGMETVAFCEVAKAPRALLAHHWPEVPCYDDVQTLTAERLAADGIAVDVICGGFPCQDLSYAGKGAGLAGERSGLWFQIARILRELRDVGRPVRIVILENVSALLGRGLGVVLGDLAALGFDAEWDCIPASAVGAPHRRDRIWIVAYARGEQHEGFGDAFRRALSEELSRAYLANTYRDGRSLWEQASEAVGCWGLSTASGSDVADSSRELRDWRGVGTEQDGRPEPANSGEAVGHADSTGLPVAGIAGGSRKATGGFKAWRAANRTGWWATEPDVGRTLDGFSRWLDETDGENEAHKVIMAYANASDAGPRKALRDLRDRIREEDDRRSSGGPISVSPEEVLFAFLREHARRAEERFASLASTAPPDDSLRGVRGEARASRPPLRSGRDEQQAGEPSDPLQVVSQLLARDAEAAWVSYRWPDARSFQPWVHGWEDGVARVAHAVPSRVERLHGLGNAVVPQIPEIIGRAIIAAEAMTRQAAA